ncbi:MAG: thiamine diphosphokinase [Oscillospiraceae bacterium]|jgi:thiamine pyrophosphokinase
MKRICYIVGAVVTSCKIKPAEGDYIIAADAGYKHLISAGIEPDLTVGDFDSLNEEPKGGIVLRYSEKKDETDTLLAVKIGLDKGYNTFLIYGCLGGRADHTIANIQTLAYIANSGGRGYLIGSGENITVISNATLRFRKRSSGIVSVFAYGGKARGVTIDGLAYSLSEAQLSEDYPLGVSNEFIGKPASISVTEGNLAIYWTGDFDAVVI